MQPFLPVQAKAIEICIISRIVKGSWEVTLSNLLLKVRSDCWGPCPANFWYLQRWKFLNSLDNLFQCLTTLSVRNVSLQVVGVFPAAISACCLSFHWALLEETRSTVRRVEAAIRCPANFWSQTQLSQPLLAEVWQHMAVVNRSPPVPFDREWWPAWIQSIWLLNVTILMLLFNGRNRWSKNKEKGKNIWL